MILTSFCCCIPTHPLEDGSSVGEHALDRVRDHSHHTYSPPQTSRELCTGPYPETQDKAENIRRSVGGSAVLCKFTRYIHYELSYPCCLQRAMQGPVPVHRSKDYRFFSHNTHNSIPKVNTIILYLPFVRSHFKVVVVPLS